MPDLSGVVPPPTTAEEAARLLDRVADARNEYTHYNTPDDGVALSIDMLRVASLLVRTGDVRGLVPSWLWHQFVGSPLVGENVRGCGCCEGCACDHCVTPLYSDDGVAVDG